MISTYIDTFILGAIGLIFTVDACFLVWGHDTISGEVGKWIKASWKNMVIFLVLAILLVVHFITS